jgi:hypothetical protein
MPILSNPLIYCIIRFYIVLYNALGYELERPKYPIVKQKSGLKAKEGYISNPV